MKNEAQCLCKIKTVTIDGDVKHKHAYVIPTQ